DQLDQPVPEDDLARGRAEILADDEAARVDLPGQPASLGEVLDEAQEAGAEAAAAGIERALERSRVRQQEVRRRERVDHLLRRERGLLGCRAVRTGGVEQVAQEPGGDAVALQEPEVDRVLAPGRVTEAQVARIDLDRPLRFAAE